MTKCKIIPFKGKESEPDNVGFSETLKWDEVFFLSMRKSTTCVELSCVIIDSAPEQIGVREFTFVPYAYVENEKGFAFYAFDRETALFHLEYVADYPADDDDMGGEEYFIARANILESYKGFGSPAFENVLSTEF